MIADEVENPFPPTAPKREANFNDAAFEGDVEEELMAAEESGNIFEATAAATISAEEGFKVLEVLVRLILVM